MVKHRLMNHTRATLRRWILSPRADLVMSCLGWLIAGTVFSYLAVTTAKQNPGYAWFLPAGLAFGAFVVGSLPLPSVRRHAEGARRLLGGGLALALVVVGLLASNADLVIALLFALAGPAWALWTTDRVIAKARQLADDRRCHSELLAAVEAVGRRS